MKDPSNLIWLAMTTNLFWISKADGIRVGTSSTFGNGESAQYATPSVSPVIFDTGTSLAYLPASVGPDIISKILRGKRHTLYSGIYLTTCDTSNFDSLFIHMGGYWLEIPPSTYIINLSSDPTTPLCGLGLLVNSYDYWLLGDVFLRNYYVIMDMDNNKIGLSPHLTTNVGPITAGPVPSETFAGSGNIYWYTYSGYVLGVLGIILVPLTCICGCLAGIYYCFVPSYKSTKKEETNKLYSSSNVNTAPLHSLLSSNTEMDFSSLSQARYIIL